MADDVIIWDGIYPDFAGVPREGPGFDGPEWVGILSERLEAARAVEGAPVVPVYLLPAVAALAPGSGPLRILDFGGGVGATFLGLDAALVGGRPLDFHVVDSPAVCARGCALHKDEPRIAFHDDLAGAGGRAGGAGFDIVHLGSTLQYIDDWRGLLRTLSDPAPNYLLLSDVFAGPFQSFVTGQRVYGSVVPFRFVNEVELVAAVEATGLELMMRTKYAAPVLGRYGPLPMDNLPPERRLDHASHFLFAR